MPINRVFLHHRPQPSSRSVLRCYGLLGRKLGRNPRDEKGPALSGHLYGAHRSRRPVGSNPDQSNCDQSWISSDSIDSSSGVHSSGIVLPGGVRHLNPHAGYRPCHLDAGHDEPKRTHGDDLPPHRSVEDEPAGPAEPASMVNVDALPHRAADPRRGFCYVQHHYAAVRGLLILVVSPYRGRRECCLQRSDTGCCGAVPAWPTERPSIALSW
jgi:hypothetical protein